MSPVTILLIDDHALFRSGLGMLLRSELENVGIRDAGSLEEAMRTEITPDLLLLDIQLQGLNGLDGIALLQRKWPQAPIVMLSSDVSPEARRQALARGATAFVSKAESADNMLAAVRNALCKKEIRCERIDPGELPRLTPRQCEVLDLLCRGLSNKLIGRQLGLSENTVRGHVQAVLSFLQVTSRSEAVYAARQRGSWAN